MRGPRCSVNHDALEEACRRWAGAGFLPDRAGPACPGAAASDPGSAARPAGRGGCGGGVAGGAGGWGRAARVAGRAGGAGMRVTRRSPRSSPATSTRPRWTRWPARSWPTTVPAGHRCPRPPPPGCATPCWPTPPMCCPGPGGLAAFLRTQLPAASSRPSACPWTSARPPPPCPGTCAARSSPATGTARPRVHPATSRLPRPPPAAPRRRRAHPAGQPAPALRLPPPHRGAPMGLGTYPPPRRHPHRAQPRWRTHLSWPRAAQGTAEASQGQHSAGLACTVVQQDHCGQRAVPILVDRRQ